MLHDLLDENTQTRCFSSLELQRWNFLNPREHLSKKGEERILEVDLKVEPIWMTYKAKTYEGNRGSELWPKSKTNKGDLRGNQWEPVVVVGSRLSHYGHYPVFRSKLPFFDISNPLKHTKNTRQTSFDLHSSSLEGPPHIITFQFINYLH